MSVRLWRRAVVESVRREPAPALLIASAVGWAAMAWLSVSGDSTHAAHAASHAAHTALPPHPFAIWLAMTLAMAPLLLLREVGRLWRGSLRRLRFSTIAVFFVGYGLVWALLGIAAVPVASVLAADAGLTWLAVTVAAVWLCSPMRQRCLNVCHRTPTLRVFGAAAQWDAWRYGVLTGGACAATCGPIMVLVLIAADHHVAAMAVAALLLTTERYLPARRPRWRLPLLRASSPEWLGVRTGATETAWRVQGQNVA